MSGWLKCVGILLLAIPIVCVGIRVALIYKRRATFWEQMCRLCDFLKNEMHYTADCPNDIFLRYDWPSDLWQEAVTYFSFEQKLNQMAEQLCLKEKEKRWLKSFYQGLGTTDLEGQLSHCSTYSRLFETQSKQEQQQYAVKGKLYRSLSVLAALTLVVLLL